MGTGTNAFEQGKLAFHNNHPMSSCDFPVGSSIREDWMRGWTEARNASPGGDHRPREEHAEAASDGTPDRDADRGGTPSAHASHPGMKDAPGHR